MNTVSRVLSDLLATAVRVLLWLTAGLAALTVTLMLMLGLALAGVWAMLTGRRAWWTQLRQARTASQAMWQARRQAAHGADHANPGAAADAGDTAASAARAPLAQRRFGRAGRMDVSDVSARKAHG
ncbi:hypothetical protein CCO03_06130 [Comamonas serinivorans]|uniref:Uncharacterized protein n=1 Tax=Comamonas serinivorans TaxID=1082851 RepID=A0A1Y0ELM7_9BURK|nr:hypothetical protein [Comamonas serinivorans]ARU04308.1 hypothetical protein CCO03_06130 [Comamonas serinivorans]